jgi:hypothetical protein
LEAPDATNAPLVAFLKSLRTVARRSAKKDQTMKSKGPTDCFETRLLLREFSHRINNEFASAIGVIAIAARSANDEAKVVLAAVRDQLQIKRWYTIRCRCRSIPVVSTRQHIFENYAALSGVQNLKARA